VALALLVAISLVFTGAQVYRVQSAAADVQEAADACALAADNVIAEYYLVARVCDAVVLSLTLTGIVVLGMGVAALCTPLSAEAGFSLINAGKKVLLARDRFARKAADGLDKLQKALPFLAAVAAAPFIRPALDVRPDRKRLSPEERCGLGLLAGRSSTQIADFVRRSAELLAIIMSFVVYEITTKDGRAESGKREKLERRSNAFVGAMMCLGGSFMVLLALMADAEILAMWGPY